MSKMKCEYCGKEIKLDICMTVYEARVEHVVECRDLLKQLLDNSKTENEKLKKALFVIREVAVVDFNDMVVRIANKAIGDFEMPEQEFKEYLEQEKCMRRILKKSIIKEFRNKH